MVKSPNLGLSSSSLSAEVYSPTFLNSFLHRCSKDEAND